MNDCDRSPDERSRRLLHGYVDGELSEAERLALEARLRSNLALRREYEALARTVEAIGALPSQVDPPQWLWPAIAARTCAASRRRTGAVQGDALRRDPRRWSVRRAGVARFGVPRLAAAAVALIAVSASATWLVLRDAMSPGDGAPTEVATIRHAAAAFADRPGIRALLAEYEASAHALAEVLEDGEQVLSPETLSAVRRAMETVDRAIAEARSALAADPGSEELARILLTNMRRRLELLRSAAAAVQSAA